MVTLLGIIGGFPFCLLEPDVHVFEIVYFANGPPNAVALIVQAGTMNDVPDAPV